MTIMQIDVDDEALREAMRSAGTTSKKDTVDTVLREYAEQHRRLEAFDKLLAMGQRGDFDRAAEAYEAAKAARRAADA